MPSLSLSLARLPDFRISKVPAKDHEPGAARHVYNYRAAYPRYLGYERGETYYPENTDLTLTDGVWKVGEGEFAPIGSIPQVAHTNAYIDGGYAIMNEHQLSIGESTCGSKITALPVNLGGKALLEAGELTRLALERCDTALCAVKLMGALAEEHGYFGADATPGEGGEALQVADPTDAWVFHVMADDTGASAVWVAQRVPKGHISVVANQFVIRTVDLGDSENFLGSSNLLDVAVRTGCWDREKDGEHVDFTRVRIAAPCLKSYRTRELSVKDGVESATWSSQGHLSPRKIAAVDTTTVGRPLFLPPQAFSLDRGHLSNYANRRRWRIFDVAAPSLRLPADCSTFADEYPFSVRVETAGGMEVAAALALLRDHYEGTPYDMTQGIEGGP